MSIESLVPVGAQLTIVVVTFAVLLVLFHLVLVYWARLGPRAWKKTDYVWLSFGALSLLSAVAQARITSASAQADAYESRASSAFRRLRDQAERCATDPGIVCRTFVRSDTSPPAEQFERIQAEHDAACDWAKQFSDAIGKNETSSLQPMAAALLPKPPIVTNVALADTIHDIHAKLEDFNVAVRTFHELNKMRTDTDMERTLVLLGPFLLAAALALRIAKVTGELKAV